MKTCIAILNYDHYKYFFSDRSENESLLILDKKFSIVREVAKRLFKGKIPPEWIYRWTLWLINKQVDISKMDVFVVTDLAQIKFPKGFVKWLKTKYPRMKTVMLFYNKVSTLYEIPGNINMDSFPEEDIMLPFDKIYTYDLDESERYGFEYFFAISDLSNLIEKSEESKKTDVFYCGSLKAEWRKGRFDEIDKVYKYLTNNAVNCDFHLIFGKKMELPDVEFASRKRMTYLEMIKHTIDSKAILEIVSDGKNGITERFYDALMYNKRLITNNKDIKRHPFFDSRYMLIYDDPSDISIDWLSSDAKVDYNYHGEYSPRTLFLSIEKEFSEKK